MYSCTVTWCLLVLALSSGAVSQLTVIPMDTTQPFPDPSNILVGSASDLALQVRCQSSSPSATVTWSRNVGVIDQGLSVFGISQEDGVLRVYPTTELSTGVNMFTCSDGSESLTVNFNRTPHLFFTEAVPAQAPVSVNVTTLCRVPDIPVARVTAVTGTGFSYCRVETERGTFRSRSVITEQEPVFTFEPEDIIVQPFNGTSRAAFSCGVSASGTVQSIVWYFEMMQFGSGMGNGLMNGMLTSGMNGVTISSGTSGVGLSKTSILLLENVDEGFYRCVATFDSGQVISSRNASLMFNMTSFTQESIALAPPTTLTVLVGDTLLLPCVSTGTAMPTFSRTISGVTDSLASGVTQLGLELASVTTTGTGVYTCTVGTVTTETTVNVTQDLAPPTNAILAPGTQETIVELDASLSLLCRAPGVVATVLFQSEEVASSINLARLFFSLITDADTGFYQCASTRTELSPDNLYITATTSSYIITAFVRNTAVSPLSFATRRENNVQNITLNCTTEGNPLPRITWSQDDVANPNGVQAITGFNELAYSTLTVSTADLHLGINLFVCTASLDEPVLTDNAPSASITIQAAPVITSPPSDLTVLATGQATFTCSAEGFPAPTIAWVMVSNDRTETTLMSGDNIVIDDSGTFTVISSTLTLSMVDLTSNGGYVCVATNDMGSVNATAQLTVNAAPVITSPPSDLTVLATGQATFTCSAEGFPAPTITWVMVNNDRTETTLMSGGNIVIDDSGTSTDFSSTLTLSMVDLTSNGGYVCVATNDLGSINATAQLTVNAPPVFLVDPITEVIVVDGDSVTLNCSVQGNPLPSIAWMVNGANGTTLITNGLEEFLVSNSSMPESFVQSSELVFSAAVGDSLRGNGSLVYCVAENLVMAGVESGQTVITIAGPPLSPAPITISASLRSALISWTEPFSLIPITNYLLNVSERSSGNSIFSMESISAGVLYFNATSLLPNVQYSVSVLAVNRAGASEEITEFFYTLEDVPTGVPRAVQTSSPELGMINVSWSPLLDNETNGVIIGYSVRYRLSSPPQTEMSANVTGGDTLSTTININPGDTYLMSVAARTQVGLGPYSTELSQATIMTPAVFPTDPLPQGPAAPSTSTIPITLPVIPGANASTFSHYWVVVIKLSSSQASTFDDTSDPSTVYPNNDTFTNYSTNVPDDTPYIVAEISASNYQSSMTFVLGDEMETMAVNDFPNIFVNGPLQQGRSYTAFVRAFPPTVPNGMIQKRQSGGARQYSLFSSSRFLTPVQTAQPQGITGGGIAGIVIAIILFFIIVAAIVIVTVMLYERYKISKEFGLPQPPSRKGSMRIRDQREIIPTATTLRNLKAEAELVNLSPDDARLPVTVEDFPRYVKSMHANTDHLFSEEYEILSIKSPSLPHVQCSLPYNVAKNRYANINCYDETRAKLELIPGIEGSDYINGNYIDGYIEKQGFIATQGPLAQTTHDFWRLVWEQKSCCIIMLTNTVEKNRAKCHQYWPEVGSLNLGDITVTLIEIQQLAYYTVRTFRMSRGNDRREVKQFHYTGWPDFGVPDYPHPVTAFIKRVENFKRSTPGPYIIHCSAGVGRTGTLMTIQAMIQMMEEEGKMDVFNFVLGLRHQRNYMVQTERQYIFIHDCMLEMIKMGETTIPIQTLRRRHKELLAHDPQLDTSKMELEYARLKELEMVEVSQFEPAKMAVNVPKNRHQEILPYDRYRVRLLLHPGVTGSDYINASYIDGYQHRHQYIVTQGPMKHTVTDFWRMIWEHRVSCILMLCPLEEKGKEQSVRYWPTEKIIQQGDMFIELTQVTDYASYTMREFSVTNTKINESRVIKHYQYSDWLDDTMPTNAAAVIDLIGVLQKTQHMCGGGPIVVHDSSSIGRSATFCILGSVLEQLKVEGTVDLFFCVHALRHQQPGLINSFDLYKFCYQAVIEFLDSFDHYSNFD